MTPDQNPSDIVPVQLAFIRGAMADLKQLSESNGQELDALSQKVDRMEIDRAHYYRKVDEIHNEIVVGNGGPGLRKAAADHETRITVLERVKIPETALLETRLANVSEVSDLKVGHVREASIDWKFLALLAVNALVVILLATSNLK